MCLNVSVLQDVGDGEDWDISDSFLSCFSLLSGLSNDDVEEAIVTAAAAAAAINEVPRPLGDLSVSMKSFRKYSS